MGCLSRFLCVGFALALLVTGCVGHRELLAALERQATRINAVESGLARVDERSKDVTMQPTCRMPEFGHLLLCSLAEANPEGWKISGSWRGTQLPLPATSMQSIRLTREGIPPLADGPASDEAGASGWQRVSQIHPAQLRRAQAVEIFLKVGVTVHVPDAVAIGGIIWIQSVRLFPLVRHSIVISVHACREVA